MVIIKLQFVRNAEMISFIRCIEKKRNSHKKMLNVGKTFSSTRCFVISADFIVRLATKYMGKGVKRGWNRSRTTRRREKIKKKEEEGEGGSKKET